MLQRWGRPRAKVTLLELFVRFLVNDVTFPTGDSWKCVLTFIANVMFQLDGGVMFVTASLGYKTGSMNTSSII